MTEGKMDKEEFRKIIEAQLGEWQTEFDELKVKAALAKADARDEIERRMADLQRRKQEVRLNLDDLRDKGGDAWQSMKEGLERATDELKKAFDEARSKMK
jgi:hypothetical protein